MGATNGSFRAFYFQPTLFHKRDKLKKKYIRFEIILQLKYIKRAKCGKKKFETFYLVFLT